MKLITFTFSTLLLAGAAHAEIIDVKDNLFLHHDFQKLSGNDARHLALVQAPVAAPSAKKSLKDMQPELFGLVGVGMVGLATRRRKRLF